MKLAKIPEKCLWGSSFLVNLQASRLMASNFTNKWTSSHVFFITILSLPPCSLHALTQVLPPIKFWRAPHVLNTCGKKSVKNVWVFWDSDIWYLWWHIRQFLLWLDCLKCKRATQKVISSSRCTCSLLLSHLKCTLGLLVSEEEKFQN